MLEDTYEIKIYLVDGTTKEVKNVKETVYTPQHYNFLLSNKEIETVETDSVENSV